MLLFVGSCCYELSFLVVCRLFDVMYCSFCCCCLLVVDYWLLCSLPVCVVRLVLFGACCLVRVVLVRVVWHLLLFVVCRVLCVVC